MGKMKSAQPASLRVFDANNVAHDVEIPKRRRRWVSVEKVLEQIAWVRVEMLAPDGKLRAVFENPDYEEADSLEDLDTAAPGSLAEGLALMLKAQDVALKRQGDQSRMVLDTCIKVIDVLAQRLTHHERQAVQNMELLQRAARRVQAVENSDEDFQLNSLDAMADLVFLLKGGRPPNGQAGPPQPPTPEPTSE